MGWKDAFRTSQAIVFQELSKHVEEFNHSSFFSNFLTEMGEKPDEEEEEEELRRFRIAKLIPIVPSDLPRTQVKKQQHDEDANLAYLQQEEERIAIEQFEEERIRKEILEARKVEEERKYQEELKRKEDLTRLHELRLSEDQRRMQAQREADARYLEEKKKEHDAALIRVRQAQMKAQEASEKAREIARQNEFILKQQQALQQSPPQRPQSLAPSTDYSPSCNICHKALENTESVIKSRGFAFHTTCFKCTKCKCLLANKPYVILDGSYWCVEDYTAVKAVRCVGCSAAILGSDHIEIQGYPWHKACIKCSQCKRSGTSLGETSSFFVSPQHPEQLMCSSCMLKK